MPAIKEIVKIRGLELSEEKTKMIPMKMGSKLKFIGWRIHMVVPNKVNWVTDDPNSVSSRVKDITKLYIYPSKSKKFREHIKMGSSLKYTGIKGEEDIRILNPIIWGWSNYFLPSPNQYALRTNLDHYTYRRCMQWVYKKIGGKGYAAMVKILFHDSSVPNKWLPSMTTKGRDYLKNR